MNAWMQDRVQLDDYATFLVVTFNGGQHQKQSICGFSLPANQQHPPWTTVSKSITAYNR